MTDNRPPDAISSEQLRQLLKQASEAADSYEHAIGTAVPVLPLSAQDAGVGDLVLGVEQLVAAAGGATTLQMLHACMYLLSMAGHALANRINNDEVDWSEHPAQLIYMQTRSLIQAINQCIDCIEAFSAPLTVYHVHNVGNNSQNPRKGLVSDATLNALGIDIATYDDQIRRGLLD